MFCSDITNPIFLFISNEVPGILYYSHIPAVIISLFFGVWILSKKKDLKSFLLFLVSLFFSLWSFSNLMVWTNNSIPLIMFLWSFFPALYSLLCLFTVYFVFVFVSNNEIKLLKKIIFFGPILPIMILIPTSYNIDNFNVSDCGPAENTLFSTYYYILGFIYLPILVIFAFKYNRNNNVNKKQNNLIFIGASIFLALFFITGFLSAYLYDQSLNGSYDLQVFSFNIEQYGLFGMTIFMAFLAFLIVKFKAFDIKLLATQALVWGLIILIGSQFFFVKTTINKILTAVTLVGAGMTGLLIVRSVKQVDTQREQLALANQEQEALLHFITHQVKGFFTKSRNIFSTLKDGDAGKIPDSIMKYVEEGLTSDESGIEMVQNILNASSLRSGKLQFNKKPFDVSDLVTKLAGKIGELAEIKGLKLNYTPPTEKIMINGDSLHIENAFRNLFENAVNYTQSGEITIDLSHATETVVLNVKDTGLGLTEADKAKLFTKGGRGDDARKINVNSTGYGLFIVKQIIGEHNGFIEARSEGRGKGSTFTVKLPLYVAPAVQATS